MTRARSAEPSCLASSVFPPEGPAVDLNAFIHVSPDLLVIRDLHGRVLKASSSWHTMLRHRVEEMEGRPLLRLLHRDDLLSTLDNVVEVETRRPGDPVLGFINRYRHKDGHYRTLEWRAHRFGDQIYGVARDVTDRVGAELELVSGQDCRRSRQPCQIGILGEYEP